MTPSATETIPAKAPVASVVVATRNRSAALLRRALDSIREQEVQDFEVIMVDDGSSAETLAAQAELRAGLDSRFILDGPVFPGARGTGPAAARNRGVRRARGQFIAFCDDDDHWIARDHLSLGVEMLRRHNADLFLGNIQLEGQGKILAPGGRTTVSPLLTAGPLLNDRPAVHEVALSALMNVMRHYNPSSTIAWIIRRDLIDRVGLFWERIDFGEDIEWVLRMADAANKILFRSDPVAGYNIAPHDSAFARNKQMERLLQPLLWAQHVRATCSHGSVRSCARSVEAWHLRLLARHLREDGRSAASASFAWQALCTYPTAGAAVEWARLFLRAALAGNP